MAVSSRSSSWIDHLTDIFLALQIIRPKRSTVTLSRHPFLGLANHPPTKHSDTACAYTYIHPAHESECLIDSGIVTMMQQTCLGAALDCLALCMPCKRPADSMYDADSHVGLVVPKARGHAGVLLVGWLG